MLLDDLVQTSEAVRTTRSRSAKIGHLAALLTSTPPTERAVVVTWLAGDLPQGRIGVGWSTVSEVADTPAAAVASLTVAHVHDTFSTIADSSGKGSVGARKDALRHLLGRATSLEQRFLLHLLGGELRQGALSGVMAEGVAEAAGVPAGAVRRAAMVSGDLAVAARAAFDGEAALAAFRICVFRPLQPMLAETAQDPVAALAAIPDATLEHKLDGARIQVHRDGDRVRVYTRSLLDVTAAVPEVVELALALPVRRILFDGEVIALHSDGRPHPFQTTMRRFGRKLDVDGLRRELPLTPFAFDVLLVDDDELIDAPHAVRAAALRRVVPPANVIPAIRTSDARIADAFLAAALDIGHEGIMAKDPSSPYEAGTRGSAWLKIKPAFTLDLVVIAVEWGSGRRGGWLSNLHLGARATDGSFVMLGKTFKGLTDEVLAWQTEQLLARETRREGHVVHVRPELVVEIAFNELQASSRYPAGVALRFARVKGYRPDKRPQEADTVDTVKAIHEGRIRLADLRGAEE